MGKMYSQVVQYGMLERTNDDSYWDNVDLSGAIHGDHPFKDVDAAPDWYKQQLADQQAQAEAAQQAQEDAKAQAQQVQIQAEAAVADAQANAQATTQALNQTQRASNLSAQALINQQAAQNLASDSTSVSSEPVRVTAADDSAKSRRRYSGVSSIRIQ